MEGVLVQEDVNRCIIRIAALIKSLKGEFVGNFVWGGVLGRGMVANGPSGNISIECRVPMEALPYVLPVLRNDFSVVQRICNERHCNEDNKNIETPSALSSMCLDGARMGDFTVHLPLPLSTLGVELRVVGASRQTWRTWTPMFDVDALVINGQRLYVHSSALSILDRACHLNRQVADALEWTMDRVRKKTFCLMDPLHPREYRTQIRTMIRARRMVTEGWKMDDIICARSSWIVGRWADMLRDWFNIRQHQQELQRQHTIRDVCTICQEGFALNDIVLNLPCCQQNFHASSTSACQGIVPWLEAQGVCPCCRSNGCRQPE